MARGRSMMMAGEVVKRFGARRDNCLAGRQGSGGKGWFFAFQFFGPIFFALSRFFVRTRAGLSGRVKTLAVRARELCWPEAALGNVRTHASHSGQRFRLHQPPDFDLIMG